MISVLHLLWIIPLSGILGVMVLALCGTSKEEDERINNNGQENKDIKSNTGSSK